MRLLLWTYLAIAALHSTLCQAADTCDLGGALIQVHNTSQLYKGVASNPDTLPKNSTLQIQLIIANPLDACSALSSDVEGKAVLAQRGNCPFAVKARNVAQTKTAALLISSTDDDCMYMDLNMTSDQLAGLLPVLSISRQTSSDLEKAAAQEATIAVWMPYYSSFDFNAVLLWAIAIGTFIAAGLWAASDSCGSESGFLKPGQTAEDDGGNKWHVESQTITQGGAVAFLVVASGLLLLLYFFLNTAFFVLLMGLFSLGAVQSLAAALSPLCARLLPYQTLHPPIGPVPAHAVLSLALSTTVVAVWLFFRSSSWAWVLQDVLGVSLIVMVLRQFRLPDLKVACVLLPLSFAYDIFWVFISPYLTHEDSVMVKVATGGSHHWQLPMLLTVPALRVSPATGPVLLGYGDVLLPGLLGVYSRTFDLYHNLKAWHGYFWPNVLGYALGLVLTYLALWFQIGGSQGQPALLYLIPCTLGLTLLLAWSRRHLSLMLSDAAFASSDETETDIEATSADPGDAQETRLLTHTSTDD